VTDIDKQLKKMLIALKSEKTEARLRAAATIQALGERAAPAKAYGARRGIGWYKWDAHSGVADACSGKRCLSKA